MKKVLTIDAVKWLAVGAGLWLCLLGSALAQEEEILSGDAMPLENSIAGKDLAFRLRAEIQATDDDRELVDDHPALLLFPKRMYATEIKAIHKNRLNAIASYEYWDNDQDLRQNRVGVNLGVPLPASWMLRLKMYYYNRDQANDSYYYYAGAGGYLGKRLYSYTQYRLESRAGNAESHQLYQYASWEASSRLRFGGRGAARLRDGALDHWYANGFMTSALYKDWCFLKLEGQYGDYRDLRDYQEYWVQFFQRVGEQTLLRPGFRYYRDSQSVDSQAYDFKIIHHLSPDLTVHLGYRYYEHSEGPHLHTGLAGCEWIF